MPVIDSSFSGSALFFDAHLETILPALFRRVSITYSRERISTPDSDFFDVDRIYGNNTRLLILIHGLEGSSNSTYIKGFASYFAKKQWDIAAINFRSCSGVPNDLPISYHSGFTDDLAYFLSLLTDKKQYASICIVGFSLGGNMLLNYLGKESAQLHPSIKKAIAISAPVDLKGASKELSKRHNFLYQQRFLNSLKKKALQKSLLYPQLFPPAGEIAQIADLYTFDELITAPIHGFSNANQYYANCSAIRYFESIRTPTLLVNALNDPFLSDTCFPMESLKNHPYIYGEYTGGGGHVGYAIHMINGPYWTEWRAEAFLQSDE